MEIKKVEKNKEGNYPKQEEVTQEDLKKNIPTKWKIIGLSALTLATVGTCTFYGLSKTNTSYEGAVQTIDSLAVSSFNVRIEQYKSNNIRGSEVRELIKTCDLLNKGKEIPHIITIFFNDEIIELSTTDLNSIVNKEDRYNVDVNYCETDGYIKEVIIRKI